MNPRQLRRLFDTLIGRLLSCLSICGVPCTLGSATKEIVW